MGVVRNATKSDIDYDLLIQFSLCVFLGLRFIKRDWRDARDAKIAEILAPQRDKIDVEGGAGPVLRRVEAKWRAEIDCNRSSCEAGGPAGRAQRVSGRASFNQIKAGRVQERDPAEG